MHSRGTRSFPRYAGRAIICALAFVLTPASAQHKNTQPPLKHLSVNVNDVAALRTGTMYFMQQCFSCHSLQGVRFEELERSLDLNRSQLHDMLNVAGSGVYDTLTSPMPADLAKAYLGAEPPDLTYEVNRRSADWIYTYLTSFYLDSSRPTGVNNVMIHNVAMPDVFAEMQGLQTPVMEMGYRYGQHTKIATGVKPLTPGSMTPAEFDQMARDITTFLYSVGNPHEQQRHEIGAWLLALLGALTILTYLIYRNYWRSVVRPAGPRWWSYWRR